MNSHLQSLNDRAGAVTSSLKISASFRAETRYSCTSVIICIVCLSFPSPFQTIRTTSSVHLMKRSSLLCPPAVRQIPSRRRSNESRSNRIQMIHVPAIYTAELSKWTVTWTLIFLLIYKEAFVRKQSQLYIRQSVSLPQLQELFHTDSHKIYFWTSYPIQKWIGICWVWRLSLRGRSPYLATIILRLSRQQKPHKTF